MVTWLAKYFPGMHQNEYLLASTWHFSSESARKIIIRKPYLYLREINKPDKSATKALES